MVQNISNQQPKTYGEIKKLGINNNGRVVYQLVGADGKVASHVSVAAKDTDVFEKSYNQLIESAPKLQNYMQNTPPEKLKKMEKARKWIIAAGMGLGAGIPLFVTKGDGWKGTLKQVGLTFLGSIAGLIASSFIAAKTTIPPGAAEFTKATKAITKLDIQQEA